MNVGLALEQALDAAIERQHALCLVLDTAAAENSHLELDHWEVPYFSLFAGTPEESLIEIAPLLIPLNELDPGTKNRVFDWVQKLAYAAPCLSWFETDAAPSQIANHLRRFHVVGLTEGQSMLMRWYDTRILPIWFACLTDEQTQVFTARTSGWGYVDRFGAVALAVQEEAQTADFPSSPVFNAPMIELTDTQYGLLVDSTELDVLIKHLRQIIPDELKRVPVRVLTEFVSKYQQEAVSAGFDDIDRQAQYLVLALYTTGEGTEAPEFKALLKRPPLALDEFARGIQELPDEASNAGMPLWDGTQKVPDGKSPKQEVMNA